MNPGVVTKSSETPAAIAAPSEPQAWQPTLDNSTKTNPDTPAPIASYHDAVNRAAQSVVNIFTTQKVKQLDHPLLNDPAFREFFGNQIPDQFSQNKNENHKTKQRG